MEDFDYLDIFEIFDDVLIELGLTDILLEDYTSFQNSEEGVINLRTSYSEDALEAIRFLYQSTEKINKFLP